MPFKRKKAAVKLRPLNNLIESIDCTSRPDSSPTAMG